MGKKISRKNKLFTSFPSIREASKKPRVRFISIKIANNPISRNLYTILGSGSGLEANIVKLEENGISISNIYGWINGHRTPLNANLKRIAKILKFDLNDWYRELPQPNNFSNEIDPTCGNESKI